MIAEFPDVPPAIPLLLTALAESKDPTDLRKKIKAMLKDLQEQSIAYQNSASDITPKKPDVLSFDVHLHGGLDLFSNGEGCADIRCRLQAADRLVRSMGLICDHIWLADLLSEKFVNFGRATNEKLERVVDDTFVLAH